MDKQLTMSLYDAYLLIVIKSQYQVTLLEVGGRAISCGLPQIRGKVQDVARVVPLI